MYIDSHAHLFYEDFGGEIPEVIQRAEDVGIDNIVVPGTTFDTSKAAVELADRYPMVYACVGFHPHEASSATDEILADLESLASHPKVVAIGEIGLDYHYDFSPRSNQLAIFKKQIEIAVRRNLPIVVHTRDSMSDAIESVRELCSLNRGWKSSGKESKRGVFHCFTGSPQQANDIFDLGFFVSYPGIVTFKNSPVVNTLKTIGHQKILLETDSPYLAPAPLRGKRNEPANVVFTAKKIAEILEIDLGELARVTTQNAESLFNIKKSVHQSVGEA
ncbi:MAG TPA: TatD family hydrolase [Bacteroidota bacterium]|nr:TatD family hydrolase [Bacteroidota bacterium]